MSRELKWALFLLVVAVAAPFLVVWMFKNRRSLKNYNPGSLIDNGIDWVGLDTPRNDQATHPGQQAQLRFILPRYGIRALVSDVAHDVASGLNTPQKLIEVYAPASDGNDVPNYVAFVSERLNMGPNQAFKFPEQLVPLIKAIVKMENSVELETAFGPGEVALGIELASQHLAANAELASWSKLS